MTTLRQSATMALEAYDKHEPLAVVMEELRAALEQPEQEPVAWGNGDELDNLLDDRTATVSGIQSGWGRTPLYTTPPQHLCKFPLCQNKEYQQALAEQITQELYTGTPQRKPLTIAEVEQILAQHDYEIHGDRARYIVRMTEEAHGIGDAL